MMWGFICGTQDLAIRMIGRELYFAKSQGGMMKYAPIEGLQLNVPTILQEFPDLKGLTDGEIKVIAIKRFKDKVRKMKSYKEIEQYLVNDLGKYG